MRKTSLIMLGAFLGAGTSMVAYADRSWPSVMMSFFMNDLLPGKIPIGSRPSGTVIPVGNPPCGGLVVAKAHGRRRLGDSDRLQIRQQSVGIASVPHESVFDEP